jgi:MFS family permease
MAANVSSNRNLSWLVSGQILSALGDQFYLIALPWLGLQLTGKGLVAGTLLAIAGTPRATFMLFGGAATDRYSAKSLLIASNGIQAILMTVLGLAVLQPFAPLWFLYSMAFATGAIDAFGLPALNTILPRLVKEDELETGNIALQGANMLSGVLGPALAGWLIAVSSRAGDSILGVGLAILFNALTYLLGISLFWRIQSKEPLQSVTEHENPLLRSIPEIVIFIRLDRLLRHMVPLLLLLGLFLTGTIRVGFPLFADAFFARGAQAFGYMTSAFGAGVLLGMIGVRLLPSPPKQTSGLLISLLLGLVPIGLILLAFVPPLLLSLTTILGMGLSVGYVMIYLLSWLQRRTPSHLLGRMMAVVFFSTIGMAPLSQVLMGYLLDLHIQYAMFGVGVVVLLVLAVTSLRREVWSLEEY